MLARKRLRRLLDELDGIEVVAEASNGLEAADLAVVAKPELIFMGIEMPVMNGLDAARALALSSPAPALIFCTAYDEHALAAFETAAVAYLLKPVERAKLAAVSRAGSLNQSQLAKLQGPAAEKPFLLISGNQGMERLALNEVLYLHAEQKYVVAVHGTGEVLLNDSLLQLEQRWPQHFVRAHRNTLIAVDHLQGLERGASGHVAVIQGTQQRPVISRRHVQDVKNALRRGL
ncbi:MAG: two-component system response regulator AlgR [Bacteroidia bacterium]